MCQLQLSSKSSQPFSKTSDKDPKTPSEASEKVSPVPSKHFEKESEMSLERASKITFKTPEQMSVKSEEHVSSKPSEMDLKEKLCCALMENQMLRKQLGDQDKVSVFEIYVYSPWYSRYSIVRGNWGLRYLGLPKTWI